MLWYNYKEVVMEKVKDLILYQVATDRHFKVGDKIHFGRNLNRLGDRTYNTKFYGEKSLTRIGYEQLQRQNSFDDKKVIKLLSQASAESDLIIRELALEDARKKIAPRAPSRLRCMFLTSTKENVLTTLSHFSVYTVGKFFQGVSVKLNGRIFVAQKSIGRAGKSYQEYYNLAKNYWRQKSSYQNDPDEILFVGDEEIVEVFKEVARSEATQNKK